MLQKFLNGLKYIPESLFTFRGQVTAILELYLEPLKRRREKRRNLCGGLRTVLCRYVGSGGNL